MNFLDVKKKFISLSGRHDLVVDLTDYVDNGADWFINEGQRELDRLLHSKSSLVELSVSISAGNWKATWNNLRAIRRIMLVTSTGRKYLKKVNLEQLREMLADGATGFDDNTRAEPTHYAIGLFRDVSAPLATTEGVAGIVFQPPADGDYSIIAEAMIYSPELSADDDVSWWTINHAMTLVHAAMFKLETLYRNQQGASDWMAAIQMSLDGIDHDEVLEDISEIDQMEGSW